MDIPSAHAPHATGHSDRQPADDLGIDTAGAEFLDAAGATAVGGLKRRGATLTLPRTCRTFRPAKASSGSSALNRLSLFQLTDEQTSQAHSAVVPLLTSDNPPLRGAAFREFARLANAGDADLLVTGCQSEDKFSMSWRPALATLVKLDPEKAIDVVTLQASNEKFANAARNALIATLMGSDPAQCSRD